MQLFQPVEVNDTMIYIFSTEPLDKNIIYTLRLELSFHYLYLNSTE